MFSLLLSAHSSLSAFSLAAVICCWKTHLHLPSAGTESRGWKSLSSVLLDMESGSPFGSLKGKVVSEGQADPNSPVYSGQWRVPPAPEPWWSKHLALSTTTPCWSSGFPEKKRKKRSHSNVWIICSQTLSWRPLLGLRPDAEKWSNWLQEAKEIANGRRNVFRLESWKVSS